MSVKFEMRVPPPKKKSQEVAAAIEYVVVDFPTGDVLSRPATADDRERYRVAYREFKPVAKTMKPTSKKKFF